MASVKCVKCPILPHLHNSQFEHASHAEGRRGAVINKFTLTLLSYQLSTPVVSPSQVYLFIYFSLEHFSHSASCPRPANMFQYLHERACVCASFCVYAAKRAQPFVAIGATGR